MARKNIKKRRRRMLAAVVAVILAVGITVAVVLAVTREKPVPEKVYTDIVSNVPLPKMSIYTGAASGALYSADTDTVLWSDNGDMKIYPASTTKLLTVLTALDHASVDEVFRAGKELYLLGYNSSVAGLEIGDKLTLGDLIKATLISSGNDAAYTIAANVGRIAKNDSELKSSSAVDFFVSLMNEKAKELGAKNTVFTCPDGYHDSGHYTCADDMLIIATAAAEEPVIAEAVKESSAVIETTDGKSIRLRSTVQLIRPSSDFYCEYATGMKTGFTNSAKNCFAGSAEKNGSRIVFVLFGEETSDNRWLDSIALINSSERIIASYKAAKEAAQ